MNGTLIAATAAAAALAPAMAHAGAFSIDEATVVAGTGVVAGDQVLSDLAIDAVLARDFAAFSAW